MDVTFIYALFFQNLFDLLNQDIRATVNPARVTLGN
jgi:hypothetical protein